MSRSTSPSKSSHATAWTLSVLVAVPLLYVLGLPPVLMCCMRIGVLQENREPPQWVQACLVPYGWLLNKSPLQRPLQAYIEWCDRTILNQP